MSNPQWTEEQQAAIDLRGQLLVAAAAGSGKTAVLVERLIRRITDPYEKVDVNRFLVVTFTKAAANEMRERVGKALDEALFKESDPTEVDRLLHQRALLYRASITTLHSFCMEILRQYFYQLDLDPAFRVADAAEADLLQQDTLEELFETYYGTENPSFHNLVDAFGTDRDDQPLMEQVLKLYEFAISQAHPFEWLSQLAQAYRWDNLESLMQSPWGVATLEGIHDKVEESMTLLNRSYQIATQQPGGPIHYAETLQEDQMRIQRLKQILSEGNWPAIEACFYEATNFSRLPPAPKKSKGLKENDEEVQKALREESKKARDEAKKLLEKLKVDLFAFPLMEQLSLLQDMSLLLQTLTLLVQDFAREYASAKRLRNIVDFSDLEHFALRLLEGEDGYPSAIAKNLQEYYAEVLVDEYQDINPVQERILQLVSRQEGSAPNLFMVGDVKQSIYRFRMADPGLFLNKYEEFPHWQPTQGSTKSSGTLLNPRLVIDLNRNFRSRIEVIEGVNFIFRQIMSKGAGEVAYDNQAALRYGASFVNHPEIKTAEGPIELHLFDPKAIDLSSLTKNSSEVDSGDISSDSWEAENEDDLTQSPRGDDPSLEELENARIEARLVSTRIQEMVMRKEFQVYDKQLSDFRPVQYADIVILMRSFSTVAPIYVEEMQNAGIPVYAETTSGYFGASEVETILSLLKVVDNPRLDIPLAAVLRSPLVGMNGTELGRLRSLLPQGDFYEALVLAFWAAQELHPNEDSKSCQPNAELEWTGEIQETLNLYQKSHPQLLATAKHVLYETPTLLTKVETFWPKLQSWRQLSRRTSLADLLWHLYEETGYLAYVGTLPSGVQRQANLRVLYDRACRYEATSYRGLFRFLRFLEKFQGQGKDLGNARTLGENENVVRLMTVHSSKGLEFPVVFLIGLGTKFNTRSLTGRLLLHSELGAGIPLMDLENQVRYPSFIQYAVKQRLWQESLAEELRILYVALTRAKERLFLYGGVGKLGDVLCKWQRLAESCSEQFFPNGQLRSAKSFLDWIGPALARHSENLFKNEGDPFDLKLPDQTSQWNVILHQTLHSAPPQTSGESEGAEISEEQEYTDAAPLEAVASQIVQRTPEQWLEEVDRRLSWKYPYPDRINQSAKTSVSELKRQLTWHMEDVVLSSIAKSSQETSYTRPQFIKAQKKLTPAERGIALHSAMQHLPLDVWRSFWSRLDALEKEELIRKFLRTLTEREILTESQAEIVSIPAIQRFVDSPLGQRFFTGKDVRREVPFSLSLKPVTKEEPVLIQGVIDAIVLSPEERTAEIIDFKTDNLQLDPDPQKTLIERYALQLALYSHAVEKLLKVSVKQCTLYSVSLSLEIAVPSERIQASLISIIKGEVQGIL